MLRETAAWETPNTVLWKPAESASLVAHLSLQLFREAGLPDGVINLVAGNGAEIGEAALRRRELSAVHFTGSTQTFRHIWSTVGGNNSDVKRNFGTILAPSFGSQGLMAHICPLPCRIDSTRVLSTTE